MAFLGMRLIMSQEKFNHLYKHTFIWNTHVIKINLRIQERSWGLNLVWP
jgi:hypothetical protein